MPLPKAQSAVILFVMIFSVFLSSVETCSVILYPSRRPDSKMREGEKSSKDDEAAFLLSHSQTLAIFTFLGFFCSF